MNYRLKTLLLTLVLVCSLAVTVGAVDAGQTSVDVEKTPGELYQEYLAIADRVNEEYGTDICIIPLEEMDPSDMPTLASVEEDVRALANMKKQFAEQFADVEEMTEPAS